MKNCHVNITVYAFVFLDKKFGALVNFNLKVLIYTESFYLNNNMYLDCLDLRGKNMRNCHLHSWDRRVLIL
jgi:hypothetical protein